MAPMKAMKASAAMKAGPKALSKGALAQALSDATEIKKIRNGKDIGQFGRGGYKAGEERREVRDARLVHDQDAPQASNQSGQEDEFRKRDHGQGKARKNGRQGFPSGCFEKTILRPSMKWMNNFETKLEVNFPTMKSGDLVQIVIACVR